MLGSPMRITKVISHTQCIYQIACSAPYYRTHRCFVILFDNADAQTLPPLSRTRSSTVFHFQMLWPGLSSSLSFFEKSILLSPMSTLRHRTSATPDGHCSRKTTHLR